MHKATLIQEVTLQIPLEELRAEIDLLRLSCAGAWAVDGGAICFGEYWNGGPWTRATWDVVWCPAGPGSWGAGFFLSCDWVRPREQAGVEACQRGGRVCVQFWDGYRVQGNGGAAPIGAPFAQFVAWLLAELRARGPVDESGRPADARRRGRPPLSEQAKKDRAAQVAQVLKLVESDGHSIAVACDLQGLPYATFRDWRRKYGQYLSDD